MDVRIVGGRVVTKNHRAPKTRLQEPLLEAEPPPSIGEPPNLDNAGRARKANVYYGEIVLPRFMSLGERLLDELDIFTGAKPLDTSNKIADDGVLFIPKQPQNVLVTDSEFSLAWLYITAYRGKDETGFRTRRAGNHIMIEKERAQ